jgi:molybdopterin-containing oxidoreductase family membrane subunit
VATREVVDEFQVRLELRAYAPLTRTGKGFYILVAVLLAVIAFGAYAYIYQYDNGLIVTGLRDRMMWGLYISLFVFFIGASMGGTFVSAILRVTNAPWRFPIVRSAELVTVAALLMAGMFVLFDIGRPDRVYHILIYGHWTSPLVWDTYGLITYLVGSLIYLYLAVVPDMARCRDRLGSTTSRPMRWFFDTFANRWQGTEQQKAALASGLKVMTILIIPVAVMMHTVTSWIFAMTLREPWDSSLFGIYFVGGAIYSGVGIVIMVAAILRKVYHLEEFLTPSHFRRLGYLLGAFAAVMLFFNLSEYVTDAYKLEGDLSVHLESIFFGELAIQYWSYLVAGTMVPLAIVMLPLSKKVWWVIVAAALANIGMLLERYIIVVGGLHIPLNPYEIPHYSPTWVEYSLMAAGFAGFILAVTLALKIVPGIPVSEMLEHREQQPPMPEPPAVPQRSNFQWGRQ